MGDIYRPKEGERVRVVYEGVAHDPDDIGLSIREEGKDTVPILWTDAGLVSVEKLEPPVEVFPPGSVVRHRAIDGLAPEDCRTYAIAEDGWIMLDGLSESWRPRLTKGKSAEQFTSDIFELVYQP